MATSLIQIPRRAAPSYKAGYARSSGESANPGLWPKYAWIPSFGNSGTTLREVVQNHNGVINNVDFWGQGNYLQAATSASNNVLVTGVVLPDPWSMTFFLEGTSNTSDYFIDQNTTRIVVGGHNSNMAMFDGAWKDFGLWPTSGLYSVTFIGDGISNESKCYVNGQQSGSTGTWSASPFVAGTPQRLFSRNNGGSFGFDGKIFTTIFHDRVLTHNEIQHLHQDPLAPFRLKDRIIGYSTAVAPSGNYFAGSLSLMGMGF